MENHALLLITAAWLVLASVGPDVEFPACRPVIEPMLMEADYLLTHVLSTPVLGVTITHMQLTAGLGMGISDPIAYPM